MNRPEDSSSDDIPYLPTEQYQNYENQQRFRNSQTPGSRQGRSHFTEQEIQELDSIPLDNNENPVRTTVSSIPRPISTSEPDIIQTTQNHDHDGPPRIVVMPPPPSHRDHLDRHQSSFSNSSSHVLHERQVSSQPYQISWGRRLVGLILIGLPAVLFSVAAHFLDEALSDYKLFSASFFIFQGIFWPCFGILLMDYFCMPRKHVVKNQESIRGQKIKPPAEEMKKDRTDKWILAGWIFVHSNLSSVILILQILSIQHLNISISLALSFGFDVVVILIRYILETRRCSWELLIMSVVSYCGYGVAAIPAFISSDRTTRRHTATGVGASVGVMVLSVPTAFLLAHLRKHQVRESVLGTSFALFGCIHALIVKEIMGSPFDLALDGHSVGWVAGLISVVFLGTIFLHLEARLSGLIWERDEDDDKPKNFSSITRTRIAVFILSCLWELTRQGFRDTIPLVYDILGGVLVMLSFLLAGGYQAWHRSNQIITPAPDTSDMRRNSILAENPNTRAKFCAFIPWLFSQKHSRIHPENYY